MTNNERVAARLLVGSFRTDPDTAVGNALMIQYRAAVEKLTPEEKFRIGSLAAQLSEIWPKGEKVDSE